MTRRFSQGFALGFHGAAFQAFASALGDND